MLLNFTNKNELKKDLISYTGIIENTNLRNAIIDTIDNGLHTLSNDVNGNEFTLMDIMPLMAWITNDDFETDTTIDKDIYFKQVLDMFKAM